MTIIASDLVVEHLFNEASSGTAPATVADATGNGNDLTISYGTSAAFWTSNGANHYGLRFDAPLGDAVAILDDVVNNGTIASRLNGATAFSVIMVTKDLQATANAEIQISVGPDGGNGAFRIHGLDYARSRIYHVGSGSAGYEQNFPSSGVDFAVHHFVVDTALATAADRIKVYKGGVANGSTAADPGQNSALGITSSSHNWSIGNRGDLGLQTQGEFYYVAIIDRALTETEITDSYNALSANTNQSLVVTTAPPEFTVEYSVANTVATADSLQVNFTVTSQNDPLLYYGLWDPASRPALGDDNRLTSIINGDGALAFRNAIAETSGAAHSYTFTGLEAGTLYAIYGAAEDSVNGLQYRPPIRVDVSTTPADTSYLDFVQLNFSTEFGDALSVPQSAVTGDTTANVTVQSSIAGESLFVAYRTGSPYQQADADEIVAGAVSQSSVAGTNQFSLTGLTADTEYFWGAVISDTGVDSNVVGGSFVTEAATGTAPFDNGNAGSDFATPIGTAVSIDMRGAFGGDQPMTFSAVDLPAGYGISAAGIISGTATATEETNYYPVITATNAYGSGPLFIAWRVYLNDVSSIFGNESDELVLSYILERDFTDRDADLELGLFTNAVVTETTTLADITEPTGGGYARKTVSDASWIAGNPRTYPNQDFVPTGGDYSDPVYGYFIATKSAGGTPRLLLVAKRDTPITLTDGQQYRISLAIGT